MYDERFNSGACGYYDDSEAYLEQASRRATYRRIDAEIAQEQRHDMGVALISLLVACGAVACVVAIGMTVLDIARTLTA